MFTIANLKNGLMGKILMECNDNVSGFEISRYAEGIKGQEKY